MAKKVSKEWERVISKYQKATLAEFLMIEYCKEGKYAAVAKKYNVTVTCIVENIKRYMKEVNEDKPYIVDLFNDRVKQNKVNVAREERGMKKFDVRMFETLPVEMEYTKFLDVIREYDTDMLTGEYLARLAKKNNMKLYNIDVYSGTKNYIKF